MKKIERRFTASQLKTLGVGTHCDGGGLYLQCKLAKDGVTINRSWLFRFRLPSGGKLRDHGLGPLSTLTLAEAREKARQLRQARLDGRDPIEERKKARAVVAPRVLTFDECITRYIEARGAEWRNDIHREQWRTSLAQWAGPIIGRMSVAAVGTPEVLAVFNQKIPGGDGTFWTLRTETASRVRGRIERVIDWAKVAGHRQGENPARWRGHLSEVLAAPTKIAKVEHHAALHYGEVAAFVADLRAFTTTKAINVTALALEFVILTAVRTGEALEATWAEIDLAGKVWSIPEVRMKNGKSHKVPLTARMIEILERVASIRSNDYVFPSTRIDGPMANNTLLFFVRNTMKRDDLTVHGFRASFKTWSSEATKFQREIVEVALGHSQGKLDEAYQRGEYLEKRRRLMDAWAGFVSTKPQPRDDNVVPMRQATGRLISKKTTKALVKIASATADVRGERQG
jgi:integrase